MAFEIKNGILKKYKEKPPDEEGAIVIGSARMENKNVAKRTIANIPTTVHLVLLDRTKSNKSSPKKARQKAKTTYQDTIVPQAGTRKNMAIKTMATYSIQGI